tara:strand:- start:11705 stop:12730 length:1026 start_codon:yes stop_codon:yes gene_type:complete
MTASRLGEAQGGASDAFELFLKQFSGEVLTAFAERNVMMPLHTVRTITSGKSAQFPMTGATTADYHTPGNEILGTAINHAERVIHIDNLLVSSAFIANIDEAMNHYDVRSIYSREIGFALSNHADKALIRTALAGSMDTADPIGNAGGGSLVVGTAGDTIVDKLLELSQKFDETDIPQGDRFAVVNPATFYAILKAAGDASTGGAITNRNFGGTASPTRGDQALMVGGIQVLMSNHIPTANEDDGNSGTVDPKLGSTLVRNAPFNDAGVSGADADEGYSGVTFANTVGVGFHRSAIGTVKLLDLAVESDYLVQNQGTLMVAKYAMGHNYLRADACVQLKSA